MDEKLLRELIEEKKMSYKQISDLLLIPKPTIAWNVKKYNIVPAKKNKILKKEDLIDLYHNKCFSAKKVAEILKCSDQSIYFWLHKYEIPIKEIGINQFKSISHEDVKKEFEKNGHILISQAYEGFYKKLKFICKCGREDEISYGVMKRGSSCKGCRSDKIANSKKESLDSIKSYVESKGCQFLERFIQKRKTRIKYICHCGSAHEMYMSNFKKGYTCKECKRRKFQGENNHNFNPNLSEYDRLELGRYEEGYKAWRVAVYRAYDYKCDVCLKISDNDLNAHHLEGYMENPSLRTDVDNGVCLCENCHKDFHSLYGFGQNTKKQYEEFKLRKKEVSFVSQNI